jgi:gliding motility-associated protein GldM
MSIPKEPRQIMINLMYLVLTALLALNVSNEILHAFKVINTSIQKSNSSIAEKNSELYQAIAADEKMAGKYDRVHPFKVKADEVKKQADAMYNYLAQWKDRIVQESGGYSEEDSSDPKREDYLDATTLLLVERGGGDTLKRKIQEMRDFFLSEVNPNTKAAIASQMPLKIENPKPSDNNPQGDWKVGFFHNMPTMAAMTLFSKFQNDVRNSEALVINELMQEAHSTEIKFDAIQAIAVPKTSYALAGQKIEAQIMLAAYNKTIQPTVTASSGRVADVKDGVADWEIVANGTGLQTVHGTVSLNMGDHTETKDYSFQYMVGSTGASMQLDKMNVFYIGVPNPITVSAAGYSLEDVSVSIPGATVTPGAAKGQYNVVVNQSGEINAAINAKTENGVKQVGGMKVRVKYIPDPVVEVGQKMGGMMGASSFRAQLGVIAELKNFDFDARFTVTSFEFSMQPKRGEYLGPYTVNGPLFTSNPDVVKAMARAKAGDRIYIENVHAKGPDGRPRSNLNTVALTLN